ncbi:MAG: hypothetical protein N3F65_01510 [Nitrososphaeria archaeon]|nr:hypothetical protein [Aigarchaeota archaeon]MCX8187271.1 hypothetical protein [Nitrososphaeria archaeon]MDW8021007.1 hypothetical protein [Nitrososphaerota archaeon]
MNESRPTPSKLVRKRENLKSVDERLFKEAVRIAEKQPRIAFYSPVSSCILNYWKNVVPRFSISEFLAQLVEYELAKIWPQLYNKALKNLKGRRSRSSKKTASKRE